MDKSELAKDLLAQIEEDMEAGEWEVISALLVVVRQEADGSYRGRIYSNRAPKAVNEAGTVVKREPPAYVTGSHKTREEAEEELRKVAKNKAFW